MIQKKICMLGGYAVGKTSLVSRFVTSMFSDTYLTTVGVKIDKKSVAARGNEVDLIIWDIYGEDEFQKMRTSYLRGASGYPLHALVEQTIGSIPFTLVLNKTDLLDRWDLDDAVVEQLKKRWRVIQTSAKTGDHVDEAFVDLAGEMVVG